MNYFLKKFLLLFLENKGGGSDPSITNVTLFFKASLRLIIL